MSTTRSDIVDFLARLEAENPGTTVTEVEPGLWIVRGAGEQDPAVVVHLVDPVLLLRVRVMDLPTDDTILNPLARRLLELNATDLVHGAYGIEDDAVVLGEALATSSLGWEEFRTTYESLVLAVATHGREFASTASTTSTQTV